jgi:hypothetical protein
MLWVGQMTGRGSIRGRSNGVFSSPKRPEGLWGQASLHSAGIESFFLEVKRAGREADYSSPSSTEVKND